MGLTEYIEAAMRRSRLERLADGTWFGRIPGFRGVWANAKSADGCRKELRDVLEDWLVFKLRDGHRLPPVGGRRLKVPVAVHA